jgi:predicted DNA-binding transcriptional regulator YafY
MDKTERLFVLLDALRRRRSPVTAETLAEEQEVSVRTIYRDVQTLIGLGAPIEGEAGLGYVLRSGFFMPPLMFTPVELEALVLGARWVQTLPDGELGSAAKNALAKIATASTDDLRTRIDDPGLWPVNLGKYQREPRTPILERAREAMRTERAVELTYEDAEGRPSTRTVWPVQLAYYEHKEIVVAWCCLREDFRLFRTDRIKTFGLTEKPYGRKRAELTAECMAKWAREHPQSPATESPPAESP